MKRSPDTQPGIAGPVLRNRGRKGGALLTTSIALSIWSLLVVATITLEVISPLHYLP
jgi:hypothetical protein